mgnify:CR=1 FL=1
MNQIYKVQLYGGYVGLIEAGSLDIANKIARSDQGAANVQSVSLASEEDIKWVKAMGGPIPGVRPKLPSEWAKEGFFCLEGWKPKVGDYCDYYDHAGIKRHGKVAVFNGEVITIDGERTVIVKDTFTVRYGR